MRNRLGGKTRETIVSFCAGATGISLLVAAGWSEYSRPHWDQVLLAVVMGGFIILADRFPIHIRYAVKVSMTSVPLFLVAVLLPLPLALLSSGIAIFLTNTLAREERGLLPIDFILDPARWMITVFLGRFVAVLPVQSPLLQNFQLFTAALMMFFADVLTFSLFTSINIKEPFWGLFQDSVRKTYTVEIIQYLIGILGVLSFYQAFWAPLLLVLPTAIAYMMYKSDKEMRQSTSELLIHMADAVDLRDPITGSHSRRVAELAGKLVRYMQVMGTEAELIETAARLHDIGKIGIPDAVLNKPGEFTHTDRMLMEQHSTKGADLLSGYLDFSRGADIVRYHHERWDGQGYPNRKKGHEIPFGARLIAVADAFDAITTDRPYRHARSVTQALEILGEGSGTQWDPEIVDALNDIITGNNQAREYGSSAAITE
jgi:putative nucleotidyltransferase with HDIG domain